MVVTITLLDVYKYHCGNNKQRNLLFRFTSSKNPFIQKINLIIVIKRYTKRTRVNDALATQKENNNSNTLLCVLISMNYNLK